MVIHRSEECYAGAIYRAGWRAGTEMSNDPLGDLKKTPLNDNDPPFDAPQTAGGLVEDLAMGVRFYSRLPFGTTPHRKPDLSRIALALPFASIVIGTGPALLLCFAAMLGLPVFVSATLAVAAMVIVTGAMAEDGLADAADGLFGGNTPARRLEIMKDSRHGSYGVAALCLFLVLRVAALGAMASASPLAAASVWLAAMLLARSGALWLSVSLGPARPDGVSAAVGRVPMRAFLLGGAFALVLGFILGAPPAGVLGLVLALVFGASVALGWQKLCLKLVGGQTGDLIGALQALLEIAALTAFSLFV
jgi:adenosylcobinamide-GDP ribazoletransferase